jgi:2-oxoglutarate ferredoxin oxidoreductase subunit alpha
MDECVGHMTERVVIPEADSIEVVPRRLTGQKPGEYLPYRVNGGPVPEFARAGDGYKFHTTGLTHDERGYPDMSAECQEKCVERLIRKIKDNADKIVRFDEEQTEGADVVLVTYGITARVARMGVDMARAKGVKVGVIRLIVAWPFPEKRIRELAQSIKGFVVPEINYGQMVLEVERCAAGRVPAICVPHPGGGVHEPESICEAIVRAAK